MCDRTAQFRPQKIPCCFCMVYFSGRSDWAALARDLGSFAWTRTGILPSASRLRFEPLFSLVRPHTFVQNKKHHKSGAFYFGRSDWVRTSDLYVPNVALYQAELHSECRHTIPLIPKLQILFLKVTA